jgi:hypothetical protein
MWEDRKTHKIIVKIGKLEENRPRATPKADMRKEQGVGV